MVTSRVLAALTVASPLPSMRTCTASASTFAMSASPEPSITRCRFCTWPSPTTSPEPSIFTPSLSPERPRSLASPLPWMPSAVSTGRVMCTTGPCLLLQLPLVSTTSAPPETWVRITPNRLSSASTTTETCGPTFTSRSMLPLDWITSKLPTCRVSVLTSPEPCTEGPITSLTMSCRVPAEAGWAQSSAVTASRALKEVLGDMGWSRLTMVAVALMLQRGEMDYSA